jgi:hypothetical protein
LVRGPSADSTASPPVAAKIVTFILYIPVTYLQAGAFTTLTIAATTM